MPIHVCADKATLGAELADWVAALSAEAIAARGRFSVAFSGGSLAKILAGELCAGARKDAVDWSKWHVFYADERCVPLDHDDSNHKLVNDAFISKVSIPAHQVHTIKADPDPLPAAEAAAEYEAQLIAA